MRATNMAPLTVLPARTEPLLDQELETAEPIVAHIVNNTPAALYILVTALQK